MKPAWLHTAMVIAVIREVNRKRGLKPVKIENKASYLKERQK
jgi:hypothetical protein